MKSFRVAKIQKSKVQHVPIIIQQRFTDAETADWINFDSKL